MAILLNNGGFENQPWVDVWKKLLPDMPVYIYPDIPNPSAIKYAAVWNHPKGDLQNYPNLKAILVLGAGMEAIDADPCLPDVPIVRLVDPAVGDDMAQYVLYWVMHFQRGYERYRSQNLNKQWQRQPRILPADFKVSVLGLGLIGEKIATEVSKLGFAAQAWSRSEKNVEGVQCYSGEQGLDEILSNTNVLVNCLPLKPNTEELINKLLLDKLPKESYFINVSRGKVVNENDLLGALNSKQLAAAALDCFVEEPLPESSLFWQQPNVHITPHMSGATYAESAAKVVAENILRLERGKQAFPLYNR